MFLNDTRLTLQIACEIGDLETIKCLYNQGVNIHMEDDYAVRWASRQGHLEVVKYLVSLGADIHADNEYAVRWASKQGHLKVVKYLISVGADIKYGTIVRDNCMIL